MLALPFDALPNPFIRSTRTPPGGPSAGSVGPVNSYVRGACAVAVCGIDHVQLAMPSGGEQLARRFYGGVLTLALKLTFAQPRKLIRHFWSQISQSFSKRYLPQASKYSAIQNLFKASIGLLLPTPSAIASNS